MELLLHEIELPLRHAFTITHGTTTVQRNLLVEVRHDGVSGYGEGAPSKAYPPHTVASMRAALEAARPQIEAATPAPPAERWEQWSRLLGPQRFALCALDEALHDLWGKLHGQPTWKLWGLEMQELPLSNYTIGLDTPERMVAKMREFAGWPIYKIKLGSEHDLELVRELRRHTDAIFRIDANTAWTPEQTLEYAPELKTLGVEFIEQPLPAANWDGMRKIFPRAVLPFIADESCHDESDIARCARCFHGINLKLTKAGGLTPALRMISHARALGLRVMAGCMNESSVGISALAQLLPLLDAVDMDGSLLITRDVATGVHLDKGHAVFPDYPGNGVALLSEQT